MTLPTGRHPGVNVNMQVCGKVWIFRHGFGTDRSYLSLYLLIDGADTALSTLKDSWNAGQKYHIGYTFDGELISVFVDGFLDNTKVKAGNIDTTANPIELASVNGMYNANVILDEFTEYNRCLTASDVLRLSERRYPL
ncbi:unnamed protein product [marine sediment metagenome]|uniref:LamG-like jellyroll fold domain-containing protein n=1 Tax=marine sediment metagenome TaxID=412755 RepID=X1V3P7_9ZZZZ